MKAKALSVDNFKGKVDFGIITIRPDEYEAVRQRLPGGDIVDGRQAYVITKLQTTDGDEYVIAITRNIESGNLQAALVAQYLIDDLDPQCILLVGIAGSVPDYEYTLGDVILASRLHDFSVSASIEGEDQTTSQQFTSRGGPMHREVQKQIALLPEILSRLESWNTPEALTVARPPVELKEDDFYGDDDYKRKARRCLERYFGEKSIRQYPIAYPATIASSDVLVKNTQLIKQLLETARDIKAVEMELAGVYAAAFYADKPVLAIRGISDIVGFDRSPDWTSYACHSAASFLLAWLHYGPIEPLSRQTTPDPATVDYSEYVEAERAEIEDDLKNSLTRTISEHLGLAPFDFPLTISSRVEQSAVKKQDINSLLQSDDSAAVLAEPGGGKTYFTKLLAFDVLRNIGSGGIKRVPIILLAKLWKRHFNSIEEGIYKELQNRVPGLTPAIIHQGLIDGKFLLLIDGLDEVTQDSDILVHELSQIIKETRTQVVVTCRKQEYSNELQSVTQTFNIDPLTNQQIEDFARQVLGDRARHFLRNIGPTLAELVHSPLLLVMTIALIRNSLGADLPDNKGELYSHYTHLLLTKWPMEKAVPQPITIDETIKKTILAEYAFQTFRKKPDVSAFTDALKNHSGIDDPRVVRDELFISGLLQKGKGGPEFIHPSFNEYFMALKLSSLTDDELLEFIQSHISDLSYREVFIFLSGLLQDESRQALLLDNLESENLALLKQCLNGRLKRHDQLEKEWPAGFVQDYLSQIRDSYLRIINMNFPRLQPLFLPWSGKNDPSQDMWIRGAIVRETSKLHYELHLVTPNEGNKERVVVAPSKPAPPKDADKEKPRAVPTLGLTMGLYTMIDLNGMRLGIDSAREIAFDKVKEGLKNIIKEHRLPEEDLYLGCEFIQLQLRSLSTHNSFKHLNINTPLDELISALEAYPDQRFIYMAYRGTYRIDLQRMLFYLSQLRERGLNLTDYILPQPNRNWEDVPREQRTQWANYTDDQLLTRIGKFYDFAQESYRWMVETYFPTLKDSLYFYRIGPIRTHASVYIDKMQSQDSVVALSWEPVAENEDRTTIVNFTDENPWQRNRFQDEFTTLREKMVALGRRAEGLSIGGGHRIVHYVNESAILHDEVYKHLSDNPEDLLGRL